MTLLEAFARYPLHAAAGAIAAPFAFGLFATWALIGSAWLY